MHYANGREAKVGDNVVGADLNGKAIAGIVVDVYPETLTCNLIIVPATSPTYTVTADCCLHITDALPPKTKRPPNRPWTGEKQRG